MKSGYYMKNKVPGSHQNDWAIHILFDVGNWPERSRKVRGCTIGNLAISRFMLKDEIEEQERKNKYRLTSATYKSWSGFMEDEIRILGKEHPFIKDLEKIRKRYDAIPEHQSGQMKMNLD